MNWLLRLLRALFGSRKENMNKARDWNFSLHHTQGMAGEEYVLSHTIPDGWIYGFMALVSGAHVDVGEDGAGEPIVAWRPSVDADILELKLDTENLLDEHASGASLLHLKDGVKTIRRGTWHGKQTVSMRVRSITDGDIRATFYVLAMMRPVR